VSAQDDLLKFPDAMLVSPVDFSYTISADQSMYWVWFRTPSSVQSYAFDENGLRKFVLMCMDVLKVVDSGPDPTKST
jgi:hypothetical protein